MQDETAAGLHLSHDEAAFCFGRSVGDEDAHRDVLVLLQHQTAPEPGEAAGRIVPYSSGIGSGAGAREQPLDNGLEPDRDRLSLIVLLT